MRLVGIDFGLKRIGLAQSDAMKILASPVGNAEGNPDHAKAVDSVLSKIQLPEVEGFVLGRPFHLDGRPGTLDSEILAFKQVLEAKSGKPVTLWDERLTSKQAEVVLKEANMSRKKRTQVVDRVAAVIMLQSFLDSRV